MEKEINALDKALSEPEHPFAIIIGGAKVSDKIGLLENIIEKVDLLLIGGGMANTFLKAGGCGVGASLVEEDKIELARKLLEKARKNNVKVLLPIDVVVAQEFDAEAPSKAVSVGEIPGGWHIMDIGLETIKAFSAELNKCKTVVWNGTMGVFEMSPFAYGTQVVASSLSELNSAIIVGGGDTAAAVNRLGLTSKMTHVSTGGGATLRFIGGKTLPGIETLLDKE
jgi:phosphoglycerate kinase